MAALSRSIAILLSAAAPLAAQMSPLRYPPVAGGQIRIEGYLIPRVASWPSDPAWSPDGREIAFSMDGRIWVIPAHGGEAVQVSSGEGYDFEPDWSPDGRRIAFSRDVGANLDIYVLSLEKWYEGLRAGRSFSTNGPLLDLEVDGRGMGEDLALERPGKVSIQATARSFVPMSKLVVLVNGKPFATREGPARELAWTGELQILESVWIALQAEGPSSPFVTDSYLFAHSTPVWVSVAGKPVLVEEDRSYLERYVEALIRHVQGETGFRNEREREITIQGFLEARDRLRALRRSPLVH